MTLCDICDVKTAIVNFCDVLLSKFQITGEEHDVKNRTLIDWYILERDIYHWNENLNRRSVPLRVTSTKKCFTPKR